MYNHTFRVALWGSRHIQRAQVVNVRNVQRAFSDLDGSATKFIVVDERVRQQHNILIHSVLVFQIDDGLRMVLGKEFEEADSQPIFLGIGVSNLPMQQVAMNK